MSDNNLTNLPVPIPRGRNHNGISNHPLYTIWKKMRQRCRYEKDKMYHHYGGRGIKVCARWYASFRDFLADMGERPEGLTLDRIDNNKHYSCGHCADCLANGWEANCCWDTHKEQCNHTRRSRMLTLNGITQSVAKWAEELGVHSWVFYKRLKSGWSDHDTLTIPVEKEGEPKSRKFKRERGW